VTLDELLAEAHRISRLKLGTHVLPDAREIAAAVIDLLGEAQPCGVEQLPITRAHDGEYAIAFDGALFSASEMRALCAMYLRAADKVDELNRTRGT
jgi:hypothetical protein